MRPIRRTDGLSINFSHAGTGGEALTNVNVNIGIDGNKYIEGTNLIESIKDRLLPNLNLAAITQEIPQAEVDLILGMLETGLLSISSTIDPNSRVLVIQYLLSTDDAALGVVEFIAGNKSPTYTP